jgi:hypothetical protein
MESRIFARQHGCVILSVLARRRDCAGTIKLGTIMLAIKYREEDGSCPDRSVLFSDLLEDHQDPLTLHRFFSVELYPANIISNENM